MRWLGIWLDSTLTFKTHVEKWTAKAQAVAYHLKGLTNTNRGPLPGAVRRAVRACIEPQLFFGAEAWYPGMTCPRWNKPAKEGPSRIRHLIRRMDKSLNTAMRAILPVWKTTPLSARHREAGIPPVSHLLQACRTRFAARLKSSTKRTRLRCARPDLLAQSAANFGEWLQSVAPRTAIVYSDGSLSRRSRGKEFLEFQALAAEHGATEIRWIPATPTSQTLSRRWHICARSLGSDQKTHSKPGGKFLHPNKPTTGTSLITTKG
ncbi:RNase H domain-containing protein [Hirsutella rhossiliensis]